MRKVVSLLAVTALASLAACTSGEPSRVDRDAEIVVTGRVLDVSGEPVKGAVVSVTSTGSLSDWIPFACIGGCTFDDTVPTVADGTFQLDLLGRHTQTPAGNERTLVASVIDEQAGDGAVGRAAVETYFVVRAERVTLPDLRLWRGRVELVGTGATAKVRITPAPAGARLTLVIRDSEGNDLVPPAEVRDGAAFDARLIEDYPARMDVLASTRRGTTTVVQRSRVYAVRGTARPLSRGAPCTRYRADGRPVRFEACSLTDGDLLTIGPAEAGQCVDVPPAEETACRGRVGALDIDLGRARAVRHVVLRGDVFGIGAVQTSVDGTTWRMSERVSPGGRDRVVIVPLPAGPARYVRVPNARRLVEVSVW